MDPSSSKPPARRDTEIPSSQDEDEEYFTSHAKPAPCPNHIKRAKQSIGSSLSTDPTTSSEKKGPLALPSTLAHTIPRFFSTAPSPPQAPSPPLSPPSLRLQSHLSTLATQVTALQSQIQHTTSRLSTPTSTHASAVVKRHIMLLHRYNDIKDIGLGLMGLIADSRGVQLKVVCEEFGVGVGE